MVRMRERERRRVDWRERGWWLSIIEPTIDCIPCHMATMFNGWRYAWLAKSFPFSCHWKAHQPCAMLNFSGDQQVGLCVKMLDSDSACDHASVLKKAVLIFFNGAVLVAAAQHRARHFRVCTWPADEVSRNYRLLWGCDKVLIGPFKRCPQLLRMTIDQARPWYIASCMALLMEYFCNCNNYGV